MGDTINEVDPKEYQVRAGHLINTAYYSLDLGFKEPDEVLAAFMTQYYEKAAQIPGFILFSHTSDDMTRADLM